MVTSRRVVTSGWAVWDDCCMSSDLLQLIDADPAVLHGQVRFRGTRVPVSVVLDCLAAGMTDAEIAAEYPSLPREATRAALAYAAVLAKEELYPIEPTAR